MLQTTPDIANILTNFTTVDLDMCYIEKKEEVEQFLIDKSIRTPNHLISGAPTSQILSYLVNYEMFDTLQKFCDKNDIVMSIYVDDIIFSSQNRISHKNKDIIYKIISKYFYKIARKKVKCYAAGYPKLVTGIIISKNGEIKIPNKLGKKIKDEYKYYKENKSDEESKKRLRGLLVAARQTETTKFNNIYKHVVQTSENM